MQRKPNARHSIGSASKQRTPSSHARSSEIETCLRENIVFFHYHFMEFLSQFLADGLRAFGGDLEELMVMAIVGQMHIRGRLDASTAVDGKPTKASARVSISASRISDVTGIPRQTVRRKLEVLERRGWIERDSQATWRLRMEDGRPVAQAGLKALNEAGTARFARLMAKLLPVLGEAPSRSSTAGRQQKVP
jgi:DNA-binding MarR family transcriptional regulator